MIDLSNLSPAPGSRKQRKRLGRGQGTGLGKTAGRGHKGFKSRSGSGVRPGFEGGQMPLHRRLPKRGFNNLNRTEYSVVNVADLERFDDDTKIDHALLIHSGMVPRRSRLVKILGDGDLSKKLIIAVDKISASARAKVESAGGSVEE